MLLKLKPTLHSTPDGIFILEEFSESATSVVIMITFVPKRQFQTTSRGWVPDKALNTDSGRKLLIFLAPEAPRMDLSPEEYAGKHQQIFTRPRKFQN